MTKNHGWIEYVVRDLEDYCAQNDMAMAARELAKIRPKIIEEIKSKERSHATHSELHEQETIAH